MKIVDLVSRYRGDRGEDLEIWLDRLIVAIELVSPEVSDKGAEAARLMPLFLDGPAYCTWKQLSESEKKDFESIKSSLRRVFGKSRYEAWTELKALRFLPGDHVDVLADEVKKLLKIVTGADSKVPEAVVASVIVDVLPRRVAEQVLMQHGDGMDLRSITSCAKTLLTNDISTTTATSAATLPFKSSGSELRSTSRSNKTSTMSRRVDNVQCYGCQRFGHIKRNCDTKCHRCGAIGHISRQCPGNDIAGAGVPDQAVPAQEH